MKLKIITFVCCLFLLISSSNFLVAQSFSLGFEAGTGASYMGENASESNWYAFKPSMAMGVSLKYTPVDSYFGLRFNVLYVSTRFESKQEFSLGQYSGEISTVTTSLLLEHLNTDKRWNFGYNFGMGISRETYETSGWPSDYNYIQNFMSISGGGIVAYKMGDKSRLNLNPSFLWTDPVNTLRKDEWVRGREDISLLIQLGYTYKFN